MTYLLALLAACYAPDAAALGDDAFGAREAAEARLVHAGWAAYPALAAAGRSPDCEVRHRAARLRGRLEAGWADLAVLADVQYVLTLPSPWNGDAWLPYYDWARSRTPEQHVHAVRAARRYGLAPARSDKDPWDGGPPRPGWETPPAGPNDFEAGSVLSYWSSVRDWNAAHKKEKK